MGDHNRKLSTTSFAVRGGESALMKLDQAPGDRESQTRPMELCRDKRPKDLVQLVFWDARASIANLDPQRSSFLGDNDIDNASVG